MTPPPTASTYPPSMVRTALLLCITIMALAPLASIELPPLVDYPNHLARQLILAKLPDSTVLHQFYVANWTATPYLAMDGIVQTLAMMMPVTAAAKLFLMLLLLLLAVAPFALNAAVHGRMTVAALIGLFFVHNATLELGFVPYLFSLGFGLCLFAMWIRCRQASALVRFMLLPALSTLLFFCHLIGFALYVLAVAAYEVGQHVKARRSEPSAGWLRLDPSHRTHLASLTLQCTVPLALFLLFGPASSTGDALRQTSHGGIGRKLAFLVDSMSYLMPPYAWSVERPAAIALPAAVALLLLTRKLVFERSLLWPLGAFVAVYFAMPMQWLGGWGGDHRLLPAIGLLAVGGLRPAQTPWRGWRLVVPLALGLLAVRAAAITVEWRAADREAAEMIKSFDLFEKGSKVYYAFGHAQGRESSTRPKYFVPCLAAASREIYVPYLFTSDNIPGIPLRYRPEFAALQERSPGPILTHKASPRWEAVLDGYDYFLIVGERHFAEQVPTELVSIHATDQLQIYRRR